jgi:hypothetical protein
MKGPFVQVATEVVKILDLQGIPVADDSSDTLCFRLEISRDWASRRRFYAKLWRLEPYRLRPSFIAAPKTTLRIADEWLFVEETALQVELDGIVGQSVHDLLEKVLKVVASKLSLQPTARGSSRTRQTKRRRT